VQNSPDFDINDCVFEQISAAIGGAQRNSEILSSLAITVRCIPSSRSDTIYGVQKGPLASC
jgi:hypothetical protein